MTVKKKDNLWGLSFPILFMLNGRRLHREELAHDLRVDPQTIGRQVKYLRDVFKVDIKASARYGYELVDWGILDKKKVYEVFSANERKKDAKK